jgi:hypothetical protein
MESATVGEGDAQLVSNASISGSIFCFMKNDLFRESLDVFGHFPCQP